MNTGSDPEETQAAPTETFMTPPTELAFENQPTIFSPHGPAEEPLPYWPYVPEPPPPLASPPPQHQEQAKGVPWGVVAPSVAAGALVVAGVVWLAAMKDEALKNLGWIILLVALFVFAMAILPYCSFPGREDTPGLAGA